MSVWPVLGPYRVIESLAITEPLGVQFHDAVTDRIVSDGLVVTGYPLSQPRKRISAVAGRSGVFSFAKLPGLREFENGHGNETFWNSPVAQPRLRWVVEVVDAERRFLPFRFEVAIPHRRVYMGDDLSVGSPPEVRGVPLFSSPSRAVPSSRAVLRAELRKWPPPAEKPKKAAAWAVLEARFGGSLLARGVADEEGRVTLIFAWPELPHALSGGSGSPPHGSALRQQAWTIQLRAFYQSLTAQSPLPDVVPALLDLGDVLAQSPEAILWTSTAADTPLTDAQLHFGEELIVSSFDQENGQKIPLLISPVGSPP